MIKESTDFLAKSFEKRNADLKMELLKDLDDALEKEMSSLKKQHLDSVFDTWNYLSEIKISLGEIQNSLDSQSNQSDVLKEKIENCCDSIVKAQQKMDEKRETFELQFKKFNRTINFEQNRLIDCLAYYGNDFCICSIYHRSMYGSNASYKKMQGNHCYHRIERKFLRQTPQKIPSIFTD